MLLTFISICFLLCLSGFFSGSETALTAASRARIHRLKSEGNLRAEKVHRLRENKERLIGAILLGNNAVNILASALATTLAINVFGNEGVFYVTVIMTLLVLIFAEVLPKTYAFRNAEKMALLVSPAFIILVKLFTPVTLFVQFIVDFTLRLTGLSDDDDSLGDSTDALRGAIELHHDEGAVVKDDKDMLGSILDLTEVEVHEIMVHRKSMETLEINQPAEQIIKHVMESRHTRIPIWEENPDNIIGVLHARQLMAAIYDAGGDLRGIDIRDVMMDAWFVPDTTILKDQLQAFREKKSHFALVVNEYGDLQGLITLEDILEEIVGQIEDEQDAIRQTLRQLPDGSYLVNGAMSVRDLNRELDWNLPDDEAATVAGLVIHMAEVIPDVKQVFHFYDCRFEVMKKKRNQITTLKIRRLEEAE